MHRAIKPPGPVVAAAVLLIAYAGMTLFGVGCTGIGILVDDPDFPLGLDPDLMHEVPSYFAVETTAFVLNILMALVMLGTSVGLLRLVPAARAMGYVVALAEIIQVLAHGVYNILVIMPVQERVLAEEEMNMPMVANFNHFMEITFWSVNFFGILFALAFCGSVIVLLSGSRVSAAFAQDYFEPPPGMRRTRFEDEHDDDHEAPPPSDTRISDRR